MGLVAGPFVGLSGLIIGWTTAPTLVLAQRLQYAATLGAMSYVIVIAAGLFLEGELWERTPEFYRPLEIANSITTLAISGLFLAEFAASGSSSYLRMALFGAFAGAGALVTRRTDRARVAVFGAMAIVTIHRPVLTLRPPFVPLGLLCAIAAVVCLIRITRGRAATGVQKGLPLMPSATYPRMLVSALLTTVSLYMLIVTYRFPQPFPWWIFIIPAALFGGATGYHFARRFQSGD